jgi:hypothetical protein
LCRILLSETALIAEGVTLTKGKYSVLFEPQYKMTTEIQYFGRHGRIGQKNPKTYSWRLYVDDEGGIEVGIRAKHKHRGQLAPAMSQTIEDEQLQNNGRQL